LLPDFGHTVSLADSWAETPGTIIIGATDEQSIMATSIRALLPAPPGEMGAIRRFMIPERTFGVFERGPQSCNPCSFAFAGVQRRGRVAIQRLECSLGVCFQHQLSR